jgi:hypothetical protein
LATRLNLTVVFAIVFGLALTLAACGGSGGNSDEEQITVAIRSAATGASPGSCKKYETQAFMAQNTESEGAKALSECEAHAKETKDNPKAVAVSKVKVDGTKATADVAFTGGGFDGQVVTIALVKVGDRWMLDRTTSFAKLDKAKLIEQFEAKLTDPANKISKKTSSCFVKALEKDSQAKVEELVLSGSTEPVTKLIESCS